MDCYQHTVAGVSTPRSDALRGGGGGFVREVRLNPPPEADLDAYPWSLPVISQLLASQVQRKRGLQLHPGVTFLVGDNGSGKSTLLEALAVAAGVNPEGGSRQQRFSNRASESELGAVTTLVRGPRRERDGYFLRAETMYAVATELESTEGADWSSYGGLPLHEQSHGESFLAVLKHRFGPRGLYLLDEPESALSPTGLLAAIALLDTAVAAGSQCVIATHSPVLLALPGARILQIDDDGLVEELDYDDCAPVVATRRFLADPVAATAQVLRPSEPLHDDPADGQAE